MIDLRIQQRLELQELQEPLLDLTSTNYSVPEEMDNSLIMQGKFSIMEVVQSDGLEKLLKNADNVYEKVKSFKKKESRRRLF